jgi:hypothetical protein
MYKSTKALLAGHLGILVAGVTAYALLCIFLLCYRPSDILSSGVVAWWTALCGLGVFNVCGWHLSAAALARRRAVVEPEVYRFRRRQLLLSAAYVLGCAFRSVLPRADVQRIGLFDSWVSSVAVGRSVATVAELCFVAQWALLLHRNARETGCRFGVAVSWAVVPLILVAELASWYAVLTTSYLGNTVEESIWALSASLLVAACLALRPRCHAGCRSLLAAAVVLGVGYVAFLCAVDIPMYLSRWLADEASGRQYLSPAEGLRDAWSRWSVTFDWEEWRTEIPWMSLYFSLCVWCSIALVHAPAVKSRPAFESGGRNAR